MPANGPTSGWAPLLRGALGVAASFLTFAYLSWVQVDGRVSWLGVFMVALNLVIAVVAIVALALDDRYRGRIGRGGWAGLGALVLAGFLLHPLMGNLA